MDEDLTRRLRALADTDAPVTVDRAAVLRAGHRRRWARGVATSGVLVALVVGGYPAVAALTPDRTTTPPAGTATATVEPVRAVVDRATGTITIPRWDDAASEQEDWTVLLTARAYFFAGCMADQGFADGWEFTGPVTREPAPGELYPYGAWLADDVRAHGYAFVHDDRRLDLAPEESVASRACQTQLEERGLAVVWSEDPAALQERPQQTDRALTTPEGRALRDQWAACLEQRGVATQVDEPESLVPAGVADAPFDEQVRIGLVDVACKDELDLVQRLGDLDATLDAQWAADHPADVASALAAAEQDTRPAVDRARAYLAEHGVTLP